MTRSVPRQLFCFWTGPNSMSMMRRVSLNVLRARSQMRVRLITPRNLRDWLVESDPLHVLYENLSFTHRSDYLRSYFMYHHGGAYSDLKPYWISFGEYAARLESASWDFVGSPERGAYGLAIEPKMHFSNYVSNGAFIFKPYTDFAHEWRLRVEEILNQHSEQLAVNPGTYHPRAVKGGAHGADSNPDFPSGYPFRWAQLQGEVFHQMQEEFPGTYGATMRLNKVLFYR